MELHGRDAGFSDVHRGEDCLAVDATVLLSERPVWLTGSLSMQKFGPDATDGQCLQQHTDLKQCIKATVSSVDVLCHVDVVDPLPKYPASRCRRVRFALAAQ